MEYNIQELDKYSNTIKSNLELYEQYGKPIVNQYTGDLDKIVDAIRDYLNRVRELNLDFDTPSLQRICVDLSSTIYYVNEGLEQVGLLRDMANIAYKSKYNEVYTQLQGAATVEKRKYTTDQLRALAEQDSIEERLICFVYEHAEAIIKEKIDSAYELLKSCSKSLSGCIAEMNTYQFSNKYQA